ncbi:hypothetical protein HYPSUDRAFT_206114 [Hypholoma sublateritium FD-334 SS-4]|uniref:Uncharacterized protein n=1 Tax=Hypholoma sublateritium (strain FD-334 SS-4) TaxID=945553 RepID=A0A0D2NLH3_HYPSF|nr:hypothetical protein HYPSUDRAFT_206114 [Hypholoma sublateritium FD-334 SS-4]
MPCVVPPRDLVAPVRTPCAAAPAACTILAHMSTARSRPSSASNSSLRLLGQPRPVRSSWSADAHRFPERGAARRVHEKGAHAQLAVFLASDWAALVDDAGRQRTVSGDEDMASMWRLPQRCMKQLDGGDERYYVDYAHLMQLSRSAVHSTLALTCDVHEQARQRVGASE